MYSSDALGRVHPVATPHALDRLTFQSLQEDVLELSRVAESGTVGLSPHLLQWARSTAGDTHRHKPHHSSDERAGTQAPIGFASDAAPTLETHECVAGMCFRPFPPLLVEAAIQRYSWSAGNDNTFERHQSALVLSDLFIAQCAQLLHTLRFQAGRDLFGAPFLHDIDEIMRGALWSGEAKGKKAASEALGLDLAASAPSALQPDDSPSGSPTIHSARLSYDRAFSTAAASSAAAASAAASATSTANLVAASSDSRRNRRSTQDSNMIHHPFAPTAYEGTSGTDGPQTARLIGGASGRGLSRRILSTTTAVQRPRQCLMSSLLALLRFANALGVRLKYWRGQLKAKQGEIARLTLLAEAAKSDPTPETDPTVDATSTKLITALQAQVHDLESQLAQAHVAIHEYEASGRVRQKYEPQLGDATIPSSSSRPTDGALAGQVAALTHALEAARQENLTLIREHNDRIGEHTASSDAQQTTLEALRSEVAALKAEAKAREEALSAVQTLAEERELKVTQLNGMLAAIKERVSAREKEWEAKEATWHSGQGNGGSSEDADAAAAAAAAAASAAVHAAKEAEWLAAQQARDAHEAQLQAACLRAKQAHNSVLKEYEDLRRENMKTSAEVDAERQASEAKLKKTQAQLTEARATIAQLRAQIRKLEGAVADAASAAAVAAAAAAAAAPPPPKLAKEGPSKEERARQRAAAAESLKRAEEELAAQEQAEAIERAKAQEQANLAAAQAAERIKAAAAKAKKEKAARRKEAEAMAAAQATLEAAAEEQKKAKQKKQKQQQSPIEQKQDQPPKLAPPTAQELAKPTPKLSSGYGRCVYEEGEWYEGWWVNYERSGEGTYQWRDGRRFEGNWLADKKHGAGKYYWVDGDRYEGNYVADKMHGIGTYFFSDGTRYEGEWECDMSHGKGRFLYSDGAMYEGHFKSDQKHGPGTMYLPSGEMFSEHWVNGKRISSVSVRQQQQPAPQQPPLQPQPPTSSRHGSRNIRLAAQEQLQQMATSARGPGPRRI